MWIFRNLTEDHRGREGEKNSYKQRGREVSHKRLLNTENKLRVDRVVGEREKWVTGIEEGTCWDEHWVLHVSDEPQESTPKQRAHFPLYMLANLTINYIKKKYQFLE